MWFERPHLGIAAITRASAALVAGTRLMDPGVVVVVVLRDLPVELPREATDRCLVANIRCAQTPGSQPTDVAARFHQNDRLPHGSRLNSSDDTA